MRHLCKWLAIGICGILALLTVLLVFPGLLGFHPLLVQSGSMEPEYPVGSMIYIKNADPSELTEGKVVTFYLSDKETLITHRIVRIDMEREEIHTKGDANELEDGAATSFSMIAGMPVACIPYLGYLAGYLASVAGKAGIILLVLLVCLLSWMDSALFRQEKEAEGA